EVEITCGTTTERSYTVQPGGRLRVAVRDENGAFLPLRCEVRDWQGNPVRVSFADEHLSGSSETTLSSHGPNEVGSALAPGKYTVTVLVGGEPGQTAEAMIKPLETTTVEMTVVSPRSR